MSEPIKQKLFFCFALFFAFTCLVAQHRAGDLDSSFGIFGKAQQQVNPNLERSELPLSLVLDDGRMMMASALTTDTSAGLVLGLWLPDGRIDSSFGQQGRLFLPLNDLIWLRINGLKRQIDGRFLVSGFYIPRNPVSGLVSLPFLLNFDLNGQINLNYGPDGTGLFSLRPSQTTGMNFTSFMGLGVCGPWTYAVWDDGQTGHYFNPLRVIRLNINGQLDSTWGNHGILTLQRPDSGGVHHGHLATTHYDDLGRILILSTYSLLRYLPDGRFDSSFGQNGYVYMEDLNNFSATDQRPAYGTSLLCTDSAIFIKGYAGRHTDDYRFHRLYKLNWQGQIDSSFGRNGHTRIDFGLERDYPARILQQPDGRLVVGGTASQNFNGQLFFALQRFESNGEIDTSFGQNGRVLTQFFGNDDQNDQAFHLFWQSDGEKLVLLGLSFQPSLAQGNNMPMYFALARYHSRGSSDTTGIGTGFRGEGTPPSQVVRLLGNPVRGSNLALSFAAPLNELIRYEIYDLSGRSFGAEISVGGVSELNLAWPLGWGSGYYVLRLVGGAWEFSLPLVKLD